MMSHKLHCTKSWGVGGGETRELVSSATQQATMNGRVASQGKGVTVYRARTTTSGQHVCVHNANNLKKRGYHSKHARKEEDRRVDTRKG